MLQRASMEELARGIVLVLFGVLLFTVPGSFFSVLLLLFGFVALFDGILALVSLFRGTAASGHPRWVLAIEGAAGIGAGGITLLWPRITSLILLFVIGVWAIVTGGAEFAAGMKAERGSSLRAFELLRGALGVGFGFLLMLRPMTGGAAMMNLIGLFAAAAGATTIASAMVARRIGGGI